MIRFSIDNHNENAIKVAFRKHFRRRGSQHTHTHMRVRTPDTGEMGDADSKADTMDNAMKFVIIWIVGC